MTLPTTSLSFSALQTEFGGSNPISLSEYVRGGSYVPSGTTSAYGTIPTSNNNINLGVFRGTSAIVYLDTQNLTCSSTFVFSGDFAYVTNYSGYGSNNGSTAGNPFGSISDGTSNLYSGASIYGIYRVEQTSFSVDNIVFEVQGNRPNSGWTNMWIGGTAYSRASASYSAGSLYTTWYWPNNGTVFNIYVDPFLEVVKWS